MIPRGALVRSRVVGDPGEALATALDRSLTGYAVLEPQATLLLDGDERAVLALREGVPIRAYHAATGRGGADALADLGTPGPCRVALYRTGEPDVEGGAPVEPGTPAELLAADPALADRSRAAAPDDASAPSESLDAVEAFLENEEKIEAIRERAREEATRRADEWGFDEAVDG